MEDRLQELNKICLQCLETRFRNFESAPDTVLECPSCPTGKEIHLLDSPDWDSVDWNSARYEKYYRH